MGRRSPQYLEQDHELAWREIGITNFLVKNFIGPLRRAMQEMGDNFIKRRAVPFPLLHGPLHVALRFALLMWATTIGKRYKAAARRVSSMQNSKPCRAVIRWYTDHLCKHW